MSRQSLRTIGALARRLKRPLILATTAIVAACTSAPPAPEAPPPRPVPPTPGSASRPLAPPPAAVSQISPPSVAATPRDYRRDAAAHIYRLNANRIYQGKLQPMLYAIGVLQVEVDRQGRVTQLSWMRAPSHAPEVVKEIERIALEASPYPVPQRLGKVTYTDTWLWDKSGKFQLDTLTEGQL